MATLFSGNEKKWQQNHLFFSLVGIEITWEENTRTIFALKLN